MLQRERHLTSALLRQQLHGRLGALKTTFGQASGNAAGESAVGSPPGVQMCQCSPLVPDAAPAVHRRPFVAEFCCEDGTVMNNPTQIGTPAFAAQYSRVRRLGSNAAAGL